MDLNKYKKTPRELNINELVIFENDNYLAINKPPFVSSLDERTPDKKLSIIRLAKEAFGDVQR